MHALFAYDLSVFDTSMLKSLSLEMSRLSENCDLPSDIESQEMW